MTCPAVIVAKKELAGIRARDLFPHIRKLTEERGLIYTDPNAIVSRGRRPKYLAINVSIERDRIIYRNVDDTKGD